MVAAEHGPYQADDGATPWAAGWQVWVPPFPGRRHNLLSVRQLALMGFATFFDIYTVALLWSKTLKLAFVGHVENGIYVINFSE